MTGKNKLKCGECGHSFVADDDLIINAPGGKVPCPLCGPFNGGKPMIQTERTDNLRFRGF